MRTQEELMTRTSDSATRRVSDLAQRLPTAAAVWAMTAALFVVSPLISPGVLSRSSIDSLLPFAAILAIAAVGQTLVVQQGGIDLSVPGVMSLSAVIVTNYASGEDDKLLPAVVIAVVAAAAAGLASGLLVTYVGVSPLVATLGVNSLLLGMVQHISDGSPTEAAPRLDSFVTGKALGIPVTVLIAVPVVLVVTVLVKRTTAGRHFEFVGANSSAARAAGLSVSRARLAAYVGAGLAYGIAGIVLAGFLRTPGIFVGNSYLLPVIAAVVLGGTSLAGGAGSVIATAGGALFLTQLNQVVLARGAETWVQYVMQGVIIAVGMSARAFAPRLRTNRTSGTRPDADGVRDGADSRHSVETS
jgi:ribose transport system permease protein